MPKGKPNKFIAPIVIAGITVGFLVSAYKFIMHDKKAPKTDPVPPQPQDTADTASLTSNPHTQDSLSDIQQSESSTKPLT